MPFRSLSFIWSLVVWTEVFAYTILTQSESVPLICSIPIVALFVTIVAFVAFVQQESMRMKSLILFALWGCIITIVLLLRTWSLVDDTFLNLYIAVTGLLTSIVWCIISHSARITEAAWHSLFAQNMFIAPTADELVSFVPGFTIIQAPGFEADPEGACLDIDECLADNGGCGDATYWACSNSAGSFACADIDECVTDNGSRGGNALSTNQEGTDSLCTCPSPTHI